MNNCPAVAALIGPYTLRFPPHSAVVERVVGDAGPIGTAALPRVPGLRMLFDESDADDPGQEVNDLARLVVEALGHPYQEQMRGLVGIYLADAEGVPVSMPTPLQERISTEVNRARSTLKN
ncbi:hypothetical protein [Streptomyces sp. NBC_00154]|uniref:hypothetical protein n=1 Tax=Streptomyces sp. NBC_00154 TaxID=2975670 RepID=UPI00224F13FF|nr:hypothetical protein [Streptomyces sp. NBC_00154]MCX5314735.1 hypothetical protein [Streptomyces sp. NBC_00154]